MSGPLSASVMCTVSDVPPKLSFENVSQAILLTSKRGQGFLTAGKSALKTRALAAQLTLRGLRGARDQISDDAAHDAAERYGVYSTIRP